MTQQSTSGSLSIKKSKTQIQKDICTPVFTAALLTIDKVCKQPKGPSIDSWIQKMWYILYKMG